MSGFGAQVASFGVQDSMEGFIGLGVDAVPDKAHCPESFLGKCIFPPVIGQC